MTDLREPRTGGQMVAAALAAHGVDTVFCVPGESYLELLDGLYHLSDQIRVVSCRHENGAANMAEAYAKLTGKTGVCLVTRGPGACNASIGVHTAMQDSTPMVLLVGQVPIAHQGREAFQEVDYRQMFGPLAKWVEEADDVDQIPDLMARAFDTATSGRQGPVVIALPENILSGQGTRPDVAPHARAETEPDSGCMHRLRLMLEESMRPMMLLGGGGWTEISRRQIVSFAAANNLPTCNSFRRHDIFDNNHPNYVGEMGIAPGAALIKRIREADLLIVVGARLGEMTTQGYTLIEPGGDAPRLIHVYPHQGELGRVFEAELAIHSGVNEFAAAAQALLPVTCAWADWAASARRDWEENRKPSSFAGDLDLGAIMQTLDAKLPDDAIITVDAGNFSGWPQRFLRFGGGRRLLGPTSGAMGYGVPAAVAAKITCPERMVLGFVGDGGFGMTGQEIATAVQYGVNPVILVFNNSMYGTIRMHQERRHPGRVMATDLTNPDFAALARAYGGHGETVTRTGEFLPAFERALAANKPALIELQMDPDVITTRTTLAAIRTAHLEHE